MTFLKLGKCFTDLCQFCEGVKEMDVNLVDRTT